MIRRSVKGAASKAAIREEAADWLVRSRSDDFSLEDEAALSAWKAEDPRLREEFAKQEAIWEGVAALENDAEARAILWSRDIVQPRAAHGKRLAWGLGGLAAAASLALVLLPQTSIQPVRPIGQAPIEASIQTAGLKTYVTAPGERSTIKLVDGSTVILNTSSKLRVQFAGRERRLYLDAGQAFFDVAKDAGRPFRVFAGTDEVRAIGTAFEVQRFSGHARVVLTRGRVALYRYKDMQAPLLNDQQVQLPTIEPIAIMSPGQVATLDQAEPVRLAKVDLVKAEAWKSGRLILEGEPLDVAVADINRYGGPQIKLADSTIAKFKVSGVFHTANSEEFADSITAVLPVRVAKRTETELILAPK